MQLTQINIPIKNWELLNDSSKKISDHLINEKCPLFNHAFTYHTHNDFGKIIKTLLFSTPKAGFSSHFFENIQEIGKVEGFTVISSKLPFYPVRDAKCKAANGCWIEPNCNTESLLKAVKRNEEKQKHTKCCSSALTSHPSFAGGLGVAAREKFHRNTGDGIEKEKANNNKYQDGRIYFEGGDSFFLTNRDGVAKYMIGKGLITITHQTLRLDKWFSGTDKFSVSKINEQLIQSKYKKGQLNTLHQNNEIPKLIQENASIIKDGLSEEKTLAILQEMHAIGNLTCVKFNTQKQKNQGIELAAEYLTQRKLVKYRIFGEDLHINSENIVSVDPMAYHLDVLMTPGPHGSIFLQDYQLALDELNKIQENALDLNLTSKDLSLLEIYIKQTYQLSQDLGGLMTKVKDQLEKAGFVVIPTPGAFFNSSSYRKNLDGENLFSNVNFFNAITGFSPATKHPYIMLPGTDVGDHLGEIFMDVYAQFLRFNISPELAVYYVGRNPVNVKDYSEAFYTLNRPGSQMGPHCMSFELETEKCTI